jgi:hypothetical protein
MNPYDDIEGVDELPAPPRKEIPAADRELLELAARALGAVFEEVDGEGYGNLHFPDGSVVYSWNSLAFSGDSFELAARLGIDVMYRVVGGRRVEAVGPGYRVQEEPYSGPSLEVCVIAARRAVTRAAAEMGKTK